MRTKREAIRGLGNGTFRRGDPRSGRSSPRGWKRAGAGARSPLILVADDEDSIRSAMCEVLRDGGFRTIGARSGEDLLRMVSVLRPDAVLMDLAMPGLNGIETTAALRCQARTAGIRIIATTASWLGGRHDLLNRAGFDGALRKPYTGVELFRELQRVLSLPRWQERATG